MSNTTTNLNLNSNSNTYSSVDLDDNVPQWKKDLILRKRAQQGLNKPGLKSVQQQQLLDDDCTTTKSTSSSSVHSPSSVIVALATSPRCTEGAPLLSNGAASGAQNQTAQLTNPATYTPVGYNVSPNKSGIVAANANLNGKQLNEQCNKNCAVHTVIQEVKMVQDSVLVMRPPVATNGDCCKKIAIANGEGSDSDTSEELQYGPGIVSKLKSKYLSLTLREATIKARPSILPMRRATSLENLLDAEDSGDECSQQNTDHTNGRRATVSSGGDSTATQRRYTPRTNYERNGQARTQQNRYRNSNRGNDSQKRARSVETLVRSQSDPNDVTNGELINGNDTTIRKPLFTKDNTIKKPETNNKYGSNCNGAATGQRVNRPKRIAPIMDETERPPADVVKQTLMIFEGPALRRTKAPRSTGDVAAKVANFKNIIDQEKPAVITTNNGTKKLGPKPHITGPKPVLISKRGSPVKRPLTPTNSTEKQRTESPELIKSPPQTPPISPQKSRPSPIPDISRDTTFPETENRNRIRTLSETPDLIAHSSPARVFSPTTVKTLTENFIKEEAKTSDGKCVNKSEIKDKVKSRSPSPRIVEKETVDGEEKEVTKQSLENISNAGTTVTYRFNNNDTQLAKSHLPRLNTIPVRINRLVPDVPSPKPSPVVTPVKLNGATPPPVPTRTSSTTSSPAIITRNPAPIITQIAPSIPLPTSPEPTPPLPTTTTTTTSPPAVHSSPSIVSATNKNITKTRPPAPTQPPNQKNLSPREIEKNSINKQKTLEQPISKVVVSMRSVDEVVANKTISGGKKSARQNEQTTILFNFQQRDTIPDYISTDGSTNTRRGKREKPKPGESGIILLPGAPAEEFADDDEDWMLSLNGPPSPCDVHFENDNILIDGKSSISKQPKRQKMRIQFDDDATQIFEYLSESSMIDEMAPSSMMSSQQNTTGHSVPSLSGSSLASYTPSKMSMTSDFQLGVTRTSQPIISPPSGTSNGIEPETLQPVTYSAETNADILF